MEIVKNISDIIIEIWQWCNGNCQSCSQAKCSFQREWCLWRFHVGSESQTMGQLRLSSILSLISKLGPKNTTTNKTPQNFHLHSHPWYCLRVQTMKATNRSLCLVQLLRYSIAVPKHTMSSWQWSATIVFTLLSNSVAALETTRMELEAVQLLLFMLTVRIPLLIELYRKQRWEMT